MCHTTRKQLHYIIVYNPLDQELEVKFLLCHDIWLYLIWLNLKMTLMKVHV